MDSRTKGIIATIAAVLLCGCPGLFLCIFGGLAAVGAPVTTELNGISNTSQLPATTAYALLCAGLIFIVIPIVVGIVTLRNKPAPKPMDGPLPPAA
jgi:hypothetical protein